MLHVQIKRAIRIELQGVPVADGKTFDGIGGKVAMLVIQCERPEGLYRRQFAFFKVQRVELASGERSSGGITKAVEIDGVFRGKSAQRVAGSKGARGVVRAVTPIFSRQAPSGLSQRWPL